MQCIEAQSKGEQQQDGKQHAHPAQADPPLDVISRSAAIAAIALGCFEHLGNRAFKEAGGHADQACDPHPEHCTWPAQADRHRDTSDVAGTNPARHAEHQGLKRAEVIALLVKGAAQEAKHGPEITQLYPAGSGAQHQPDR